MWEEKFSGSFSSNSCCQPVTRAELRADLQEMFELHRAELQKILGPIIEKFQTNPPPIRDTYSMANMGKRQRTANESNVTIHPKRVCQNSHVSDSLAPSISSNDGYSNQNCNAPNSSIFTPQVPSRFFPEIQHNNFTAPMNPTIIAQTLPLTPPVLARGGIVPQTNQPIRTNQHIQRNQFINETPETMAQRKSKHSHFRHYQPQ
jgi:hypothetical protein